MLKSVMLRVEAVKGSDVEEVCQDMIVLTTVYPLTLLKIICEVNGIEMIAKNGDTKERVLETYRRQVQL